MPGIGERRLGRLAAPRVAAALVAASALLVGGLTPPEAAAAEPPSDAREAWPAPATASAQPGSEATPQPQPQPQPEAQSDEEEEDDDDDDDERGPSKGMRAMGVAGLAGGLSMFGLTYLVTGISGMIMYDVGQRRSETPTTAARGDQLQAIGGRLVIPVAGPFLALPYMRDADGKALGALSGGFQLLGLGLTIFGAVTLSNYNRRSREAQQALARRRLFVSGVATPRYSGASLLFRF